MKLYQIIEGVHDHYLDDQGLKVLPGHTGSVTLAHGDFGKALFDTGSRGTWPDIKKTLAQKGVMPEDIDFVFLTHLHLDHSFNVAHFPKARVFAWAHEWGNNSTKELVSNIDQETIPEIIPGLRAVKAPGHDECLNAYFIENADSLTLLDGEVLDLVGMSLCTSGDALNEIVIQSKGEKLPYFYDEVLYKKSAQEILNHDPDFIIPGHGSVILKPVEGWSEIV